MFTHCAHTVHVPTTIPDPAPTKTPTSTAAPTSNPPNSSPVPQDGVVCGSLTLGPSFAVREASEPRTLSNNILKKQTFSKV